MARLAADNRSMEYPFKSDERARCTGHLVLGVRHLHCLGIIHGDLSDTNLLMHYKPGAGTNLRLTDFGASVIVPGWRGNKPTPREPIPGVPTGTGTYRYSAPENCDAGPNAASGCFAKDDWSGAPLCEFTTQGLIALSPFAVVSVFGATAHIITSHEVGGSLGQ